MLSLPSASFSSLLKPLLRERDGKDWRGILKMGGGGEGRRLECTCYICAIYVLYMSAHKNSPLPYEILRGKSAIYKLILVISICGLPPLPPNGFVIVSNDTIERSSMSFICPTFGPIYTTVCNQEGDWEPRPVDICQLGMHNIYNNNINTLNYCFLYPTKFMAIATANIAMLDAVTLSVISSISAFIFTSIAFFCLDMSVVGEDNQNLPCIYIVYNVKPKNLGGASAPKAPLVSTPVVCVQYWFVHGNYS